MSALSPKHLGFLSEEQAQLTLIAFRRHNADCTFPMDRPQRSGKASLPSTHFETPAFKKLDTPSVREF